MSHTFDTYAFADDSGATSPQQKWKHIVLATMQRGAVRVSGAFGDPVRTESHTRASLLQAVQVLLIDATARGERVIMGFDHNYSFPVGFFETVTGVTWEDRTGQWGKWFAPTLNEEERRRASLEGFVLGVL